MSDLRQASASSVPVVTQFFRCATPEHPLPLRAGGHLAEATLAYETHGQLNAACDNAVLIFHAMTGSHHLAGWTPEIPGVGERWTEECQIGWWDAFVGPGRAVDTEQWFVVAANHLGSCYGSTGPTSLNPATGRSYGADFPVVTIPDIVEANRRLLRHLGITRLRAAIGGSIGGLMVTDFAVRYPQELELAVPIASGAAVTSLQRLLNLEQIAAIHNDPDFAQGYYDPARPPRQGLALARMIAHKTFISLNALDRRVRQEIRPPLQHIGNYCVTSPHESYMLYQGQKFTERFDANAYLRIVEAWQRFDLAAAVGEESVVAALRRARAIPFLLFTIHSDVCFYPEEQEHLEDCLRQAGVPVTRLVVESEKGHDSFLLESHLYAPTLRLALQNPALVGTEKLIA